MLMNFDIKKDIETIELLLDIDDNSLIDNLNITRMTLFNWKQNASNSVNYDSLECLYKFAYKNKINLNKLKEDICKELENNDTKILFHGSRRGIDGNISIDKSSKFNDFSRGFYLGDNLIQSSTFVCGYNDSSIYYFSLNLKGLIKYKFTVSLDWMIIIAYFRGRLNKYKYSNIIRNILNKIKDVDVIIAPIADNQMFQIIDEFIEGNLTDEQTIHSLSATNLGYQYILKTEKAINNLHFLDRGYLSSDEKIHYLKIKSNDNKNGLMKVKLAKREYASKGKYIEELFNE